MTITVDWQRHSRPSSWWRINWYGWFIFHTTNDCVISWVFGGFFKRGVLLAPGEKTSSEKYDNQAVIHSWNNQDGKSATLTNNPADRPSRRMSAMDSQLTYALWPIVQHESGGHKGHTCDLMALDSNAMLVTTVTDCATLRRSRLHGLQEWTSSHKTSGDIALLCNASTFSPHWFCLVHCFVFRRVIDSHALCWTLAYIQKILVASASISGDYIASADSQALLIPSKRGWISHSGIPGDL